MSFKEDWDKLPNGGKFAIMGGGAIALYFLFKSVTGASSAASTAAPVVPSGTTSSSGTSGASSGGSASTGTDPAVVSSLTDAINQLGQGQQQLASAITASNQQLTSQFNSAIAQSNQQLTQQFNSSLATEQQQFASALNGNNAMIDNLFANESKQQQAMMTSEQQFYSQANQQNLSAIAGMIHDLASHGTVSGTSPATNVANTASRTSTTPVKKSPTVQAAIHQSFPASPGPADSVAAARIGAGRPTNGV